MDHHLRIRAVAAADWPGVAALEATAYGDSSLLEGRAALESRGRASPSTCLVLHLDGQLAGYVLALPYPAFRYPDLSRPERTVFRSPNLHLHDLVVAEPLRGQGLGSRLLHRPGRGPALPADLAGRRRRDGDLLDGPRLSDPPRGRTPRELRRERGLHVDGTPRRSRGCRSNDAQKAG